MSDNNFDKHIKDQLDGFKLDFDQSNWERFNDRLDQEFGKETTTSDDLHFDKEIADKLSTQEVPYNATHWSKLLERLELEDRVNNRLITLMLMEITAVILVVFAIWNWKGAEYFNQHKENNAAKIPVAAVIESDSPEQASTDNQTSIVEINKPTSSTSYPSSTSSEIVKNNQNTDVLNITDTSVQKVQNDVKAKDMVKDFNPSLNNNNDLYKASDVILDNEELYNRETFLHSRKKTDALESDVLNQQQMVETVAPSIRRSAVASFTHLDNDPRISLENRPFKHPMGVLINIKKEESKLQLSTGLIGSVDAYLIRSPDDPVYPYPSYYTDSKGLTGGALFSVRSKSVELETGVLYSSVEYAPRKINENYSSQGRYYSTALEDILFNVISVPVNFKIHYNINEKNSFYLALGSTYNAIINSNFNISTTIIAAPLNPVADLDKNEPDLNKKPQIPGAFEGGSLLKNTFITADLGIGYKRNISSRIGVFIQPTLQTHFSGGIGPNGDRLHKLSLFAGAKYNLNP